MNNCYCKACDVQWDSDYQSHTCPPSKTPDCSNSAADVFRLLAAVGAAVNYFDDMATATEGKSDATLKLVHCNCRLQISNTADALRAIIEKSVCPVWGIVSEDVRDKCRAAGF